MQLRLVCSEGEALVPLSSAVLRSLQQQKIASADAEKQWMRQICDSINCQGLINGWNPVHEGTLVLVEDVAGLWSGFSLAGLAAQLLLEEPAIKMVDGILQLRLPTDARRETPPRAMLVCLSVCLACEMFCAIKASLTGEQVQSCTSVQA
jgi:hypothetical protein